MTTYFREFTVAKDDIIRNAIIIEFRQNCPNRLFHNGVTHNIDQFTTTRPLVSTTWPQMWPQSVISGHIFGQTSRNNAARRVSQWRDAEPEDVRPVCYNTRMPQPAIFSRMELMLGTPTTDALKATRVAIFGLGGVGSWCAESLVRSGVGKLLLVDSDQVCVTNVNRQLMATTETVGEVKVEVLAQRLRAINPDVELDVRPQIYDETTAASFGLEGFDYVIDAIDSLACKAALIRHALSIPTVTLFASMGAALKMDPFQIQSSEFRKIEGDGLARALRQKFKKTGGYPQRKFICVWSPEHRENLGDAPQPDAGDTWSGLKARINGTIAHTTAIFGFALAGLVVQDVEKKTQGR